MKLRVCRADSSAASSSGKPSRISRCRRPSSIACVQALHGAVPPGDGLGRPFARGEDDQCVEHVGVEAGGVRESVVAALDGGAQPPAQRGVEPGLVLQVRHPERDVPGLVARARRVTCRVTGSGA